MTIVGIAIAGALGALARYGVSLAALRWFGSDFPAGTLIVNLVGCLCLGFLAELTLDDPTIATRTRAIIGTGFFGAFTTFSTFGVETFRAIEAGEWNIAALNIALNVVVGLLAVSLGFSFARQLGA